MNEKFIVEFDALLKKYARIYTKIAILAVSIDIQEKMEIANNVYIPIRTSTEIKRNRQLWKQELTTTEKDIYKMLEIINKEAKQ